MPVPFLLLAAGAMTAVPLAAVIGWRARETAPDVTFSESGGLVVNVAPSNHGEKILALGVGALLALKFYKGGK